MSAIYRDAGYPQRRDDDAARRLHDLGVDHLTDADAIAALESLAIEAAVFVRSRRKRADASRNGFRVEYRALPPKPASGQLMRSYEAPAQTGPTLSPIAADLANILRLPGAFPRRVM